MSGLVCVLLSQVPGESGDQVGFSKCSSEKRCRGKVYLAVPMYQIRACKHSSLWSEGWISEVTRPILPYTMAVSRVLDHFSRLYKQKGREI